MCLPPHPELGIAPPDAFKRQRHCRRSPATPIHQPRYRVPAHSQAVRAPCHRPALGFHALTHAYTRMRWICDTHIRPALLCSRAFIFQNFSAALALFCRSSSVKSDCQRSSQDEGFCRDAKQPEVPEPRQSILLFGAFRSRLAAPTPPCVHSIICRKYVGRYPCSAMRGDRCLALPHRNSASRFSAMYQFSFLLSRTYPAPLPAAHPAPACTGR